MIRSKHINSIIAIITALCVLGVTVMMAWPHATNAAEGKTIDYESLFQDTVIQVDIEADDNDWQTMLQNATDETYISCNVKINGKTIQNVGIRPKGNSSLTQVASSDSDRYSFKIEFDHYIDGQTYDGLDKLVLNNIQSDNTYMKEYLSYQMMDYIGVTTPLYTYANITVNGEEWGLYFALEGVEDAYSERTGAGNLYKPESDDMGGKKDKENAPQKENGAEENGENPMAPPALPNQSANEETDANLNNENETETSNTVQMTNKKDDFGNRGGQNSQDCALKYIDDSIDSYKNIFDNAVFDVEDSDKQKVITALKNLNDGTNLETYINVDEVLRYFAANTVLVNLDSYSGTMFHNYYLEEKEGKLSILPWDFNLSFAGFGVHAASDAVNFPIDTPVSGNMSDHPLLAKLLENETYQKQFHEYLQPIVDGYFQSGLFENTITKLQKSINKYVKADATAFCSYDEYLAGVTMLKNYGTLRAQSVAGQLKGTIPSTMEAQSQNSSALVDASSIDLSVMGSQGGGMKGGGPMKMAMPAAQNAPQNDQNESAQNSSDGSNSTATPNKDQAAANIANAPPAKPDAGSTQKDGDTSSKSNNAKNGQDKNTTGNDNENKKGGAPFPKRENNSNNTTTDNQTSQTDETDLSLSRDTMKQAMQIIGDSETLTEEQKSQLQKLGLSDSEIEKLVERKTAFGKQAEDTRAPNNANDKQKDSQTGQKDSQISRQTICTLGASVLVLIGAIVFVACFRKKV